ncbi:MAG: hypothetical protein ACI9BF_000902 [Candidatus Paceibacteria bacterium]|jgi:hypothetical protein
MKLSLTITKRIILGFTLLVSLFLISHVTYAQTTEVKSASFSEQLSFIKNSLFDLLGSISNQAAVSVSQEVQLVSGQSHTSDSGNLSNGTPIQGLWDGCTDQDTISCLPGGAGISSFWAEFDFNAVYDLESARVFGDYKGSWVCETWSLEYKVLAGDAYTNAVSDSDCDGNDWFNETLSGVSAQYVRVTINGDAGANKTQVRELEIYGRLASGLESNTTPEPEPTSTCSYFSYSSWGSCQSDDTQTRTVNSSSPSGCEGGAPVVEQSCSYETPTPEPEPEPAPQLEPTPEPAPTPAPSGGLVFSDNFNATTPQDIIGRCRFGGDTGGDTLGGDCSALPPNWNFTYTSDSNNANPPCEITVDAARGGFGLGFKVWDESNGDKNSWGSDCQLAKHLGPDQYEEVWTSHFIRFNPDQDPPGAAKMFRIGHYNEKIADGTTESTIFNTNKVTSEGPTISGLVFYDLKQVSSSHYRHKFALRCDPVYKCGTYDEVFESEFKDSGGEYTDKSWTNTFGDGKWHQVEFHMVMNSGAGAKDGVIEMYWDGFRQGGRSDVPWLGSGHNPNAVGWNMITLAGNQNNYWDGQSNTEQHVYDIDDVQVCTSRCSSDGSTPTSTLDPEPEPAPTISTKFSHSDRVQPIDTVNILSTAGGALLGTQLFGTNGTVISGPTVAGGYTYWQINFDNGTNGWAAEDWLVETTTQASSPSTKDSSYNETTSDFTTNTNSDSSVGSGGSSTSSNETTSNTPPSGLNLITKNLSYVQRSSNSMSVFNDMVAFLNAVENESLSQDGSYDTNDLAAIKRFQQKYKREILDVWNLEEATGYVGITTRLKMNFLLKGTSAVCPVFTEYNGGRSGATFSTEIGKTQEILRDLDMYSGSINNTWDTATNEALITFQETFREVMLDPWNISEGTGYKYKTTNKFLNYFVGCDTGSVYLEGVGVYEGI